MKKILTGIVLALTAVIAVGCTNDTPSTVEAPTTEATIESTVDGTTTTEDIVVITEATEDDTTEVSETETSEPTEESTVEETETTEAETEIETTENFQ